MNMKYAMRSEDTEQINVVSWANWNMNRYPELRWLFHVPNGGSRNRAEAVKFKQMGVKAGVSDLCLPYPKGSYCGLFVEMKFGNNRQQDTQKEFLADMAAAGHFVATCYSAEEAIKVIEEYLNLSDALHMERNLNMSIPNNSILKDGKILPGSFFLHQRVLVAAGLRARSAVGVPAGHVVGQQAPTGIAHAHCAVAKDLELQSCGDLLSQLADFL